MKTIKYFISFENLEISMCSTIEISKAEYLKQLKYMRNQAKTTKDEEYPVYEALERTCEDDKTIETTTSFNCGCAYTDLIKLECKNGYHFINKK